jgi:predicted ribosomally synthesized peptide with SipW-like signal peptide
MTNRLFFSGLLIIGVMGSPGSHGTLAYLTSSVQSTGNQFSAGTVHIANSLAMGATLSMDNLIGGDNFDAQLDVANSGTLSLIYAVSTSLTGSAALAHHAATHHSSKDGQPMCGARWWRAVHG